MSTKWNCFNCGIEVYDKAKRPFRTDMAVWCPICALLLCKHTSLSKDKVDHFINKNGIITVFLTTALRVTPHGPVVMLTHNNGCVCTKCNSRNDYAIPNQSNGTYVCFECR